MKSIDQVDEASYNLPKSIHIKIKTIFEPTFSIEFIEKLTEIFDKTITLFDEITYRGCVRNLFFFSHIAKKLDISYYSFYDEKNTLIEGNVKSITDHLTIRNASLNCIFSTQLFLNIKFLDI